jgi:hypothetical protein
LLKIPDVNMVKKQSEIRHRKKGKSRKLEKGKMY